MAADQVRYHGVERHEEVDVIARRDDGRTTKRKFVDALASPSGTLKLFGGMALAAMLLSPIPFIPEMILVTAGFIFLLGYNYKKKTWDMPYRVPRYLASMGYKDKSTGSVGEGLIYLGAARSSRTELMEEVWATPGDTRTHRLVVGTTGSGKTEEMMGSIFNMMMLNSGVVLIDGKASQDSWDSIYRIARTFGREEELMLVNYIMGGQDVFTEPATKLSNTYNPFSLGSSAMKSELMNGLMPSGKQDVWSERAVSFNSAIMKPLSFLAERGYVLFSPRLLVDYYSLERIENLLWFGVLEQYDGTTINLKDEFPADFARLQLDVVSGSLKLYVNELPGYAMARPTEPHKLPPSNDQEIREALAKGDDAVRAWAQKSYAQPRDTAEPMKDVNGRLLEKKGGGQPQPNPAADAARQKVFEQHGYITMQLVRSTALLTFEYGHIFNVDQGEIDYRDMMLNRRIMYTALPSLERSPASLGALGKLAVASIKSVLASLLDKPFEGFRREIIDGRPSNSEIPYNIMCDEYGYYVVEGFAVAPAQARSFGVSITFGTQELADLKKGDANEAEATWSNTNLRLVGRMTGGEESETFKKFSGAAGSAHVTRAMDMTHRRGRIGAQFDLSTQSRAEKVSRLSVDDLNGQQDGQFTLVVGAKTDASAGTILAREGGIRVVRYQAFYTGNVPKVPFYRLNHFVSVLPPTEQRLRDIALSQSVQAKLDGIKAEAVERFLSRPEQQENRKALSDSVLGHLVQAMASLPDDMSDEDAAAKGVLAIRQYVNAKLGALVRVDAAQEIEPTIAALLHSIEGAVGDAASRATLAGVLEDLKEDLIGVRAAERTMLMSGVRSIDKGRQLLDGLRRAA